MANWQKIIRFGIGLVIFAGLCKLVFVLINENALLNLDKTLNAAMLVIVSGLIIYYFIGSANKSNLILKILLWLMIFLVPIIGYAFRFELEYFKYRLVTVLLPSYSWTNQQGELVISKNRDNHFYIIAKGDNGAKIKFLVDTGASDIALTKEDARSLGLNLEKLQYTRIYNTANGTSGGAPVKIKSLTIGSKTFYDLNAHVSAGDLDISLFGMSVISRFKGFKITKDNLILY